MDANEKDFEKVAKEAKLTVNPAVKVKAMDENFGSAGNQRQIVRWAFESSTKVGDVKRFEIANVGNIIAKLKKVYEKGLTPIDDARPGIEPILRNKKKAALITAKMKGASLAAIAKSNATTVQQALDVNLENASIPNVGQEKKVVGIAFASAVNKLSAPIEGNSGVFVIQTKLVTKAPALKNHTDYIAKVKSQTSSYSGRVIPALKAEADIEDNRAQFNY